MFPCSGDRPCADRKKGVLQTERRYILSVSRAKKMIDLGYLDRFSYICNIVTILLCL